LSATAGSRGTDEDRTLSRLRGLRSDLIDPAIYAHHGHIVKRTGDGLIADFRGVVDAVRCAIEVQNGLLERNAGLPSERRIEYRVGIHLGTSLAADNSDRPPYCPKRRVLCWNERIARRKSTLRNSGQ
jgi:adenylate cyclase